MAVFSSPTQLQSIKALLTKYARLPFASDVIPGVIVESIVSHVRDASRTGTYDFVDVVKPSARCGWQVKSTKATTPVTWKRAKLPNSVKLIESSRDIKNGTRELGDAIISFCNAAARKSFEIFDINEIGYCRLVIQEDRTAIYFERILCTRSNPNIFDPADFEWRWSVPKQAIRKEQLSALHGIHKATGKKWWAWHGLGENQLHFSGEKSWWPQSDGTNAISFKLPSPEEKISLEKLMEFLESSHIPT